ncbi:MAG: hypothetical protein A3A89_01880 [Candidatus Magasanikbacteria bacterium RIFCSPLOWO2_01_FULL_33_34]|nr:MAG: hypothetical protein A3B83_04960 [Candidatus Magasanikbacteria bacterium RIFCSPHIGHO2_02_FULL_33_17]OGH76166.1 MAG: hypothetical protein A3A89_01880 [Candidatus Magasanikbacteria bacterium RIFCSPLOWO2_01_FULL_33_34]OGH81020.1 MAG: hypothetical protein A3F93_04545 [Candidatus Magasanikbacteria bacterium RIFCSPLOWO2_12_FULL_34_7]
MCPDTVARVLVITDEGRAARRSVTLRNTGIRCPKGTCRTRRFRSASTGSRAKLSFVADCAVGDLETPSTLDTHADGADERVVASGRFARTTFAVQTALRAVAEQPVVAVQIHFTGLRTTDTRGRTHALVATLVAGHAVLTQVTGVGTFAHSDTVLHAITEQPVLRTIASVTACIIRRTSVKGRIAVWQLHPEVVTALTASGESQESKNEDSHHFLFFLPPLAGGIADDTGDESRRACSGRRELPRGVEPDVDARGRNLHVVGVADAAVGSTSCCSGETAESHCSQTAPLLRRYLDRGRVRDGHDQFDVTVPVRRALHLAVKDRFAVGGHSVAGVKHRARDHRPGGVHRTTAEDVDHKGQREAENGQKQKILLHVSLLFPDILSG